MLRSSNDISLRGLERLSRRQVQLVERSLRLLGGAPLDRIMDSVNKALADYARAPARLKLAGLREPDFQSYLRSIATPTFLGVIGLFPSDSQAIIEVDTTLALGLAERALGGELPETVNRELTDMEQQLLQLILLKILAQVHKDFGANAQSHMRLNRITTSVASIRELFAPEDPTFLLSFILELGELRGFVKLCLPHPFLHRAHELFSPELLAPRPYLTQPLPENVSSMSLPFWIEVGRLTISPEDMEAVGPQDILLFDQAHLGLKEAAPGSQIWDGSMDIYFGKGYHPIEARVVDGGGPIRLEIVGYREKPMPEPKDSPPPKEQKDQFTQEQVLEEVSVPVVAAIGRTQVTLKQALELYKGQVLELDRAPGDPVDVLVNGEPRARGELVDVEGKLGVRLTELLLPPNPTQER